MKKRKINYYVYHYGTGTLIDASDEVTVFSDEDFTDEEIEALDDGDTSVAEMFGVDLMKVIRYYEKVSYAILRDEILRDEKAPKKSKKKSKKGKGKKK